MGNFFLHSEVGHFVIYLAATAMIGGMPAPTATSGVAYKWAFASLNSFAMNFTRAFGTKVEKSPNFVPAVAAILPGTEPVVAAAVEAKVGT